MTDREAKIVFEKHLKCVSKDDSYYCNCDCEKCGLYYTQEEFLDAMILAAKRLGETDE